MKFDQPLRQRRPRHRLAIVQLRSHLEPPTLRARQHKLRDTCASFPLPRPSTLCCPSSRIRLISNEQTAAAIFSLLNDYLISNNRHPLGFLNYWLYDPIVQAVGFNDITSGNNPGCGYEGFSAGDGWDPVRPTRPSLFIFDSADSEPRRSPV